MILLRHNVLFGIKRPEAYILSLISLLVFFNPRENDNKLKRDFVAGRISQILSFLPFEYSPLNLVFKGKGGFSKIHHFTFSPGFFVNNCILKKAVHLHFIRLDNVLQKVREARRDRIIIKCKIKNIFRKIFLMLYVW